jgi:hypothetical protein
VKESSAYPFHLPKSIVNKDFFLISSVHEISIKFSVDIISRKKGLSSEIVLVYNYSHDQISFCRCISKTPCIIKKIVKSVGVCVIFHLNGWTETLYFFCNFFFFTN